MRKAYLILAILVISMSMKAQMILEFDTNLSDGTTINFILDGTVDVSINWGDGNLEDFTSNGDKEHTYALDGIYTVSISGTLTQFRLSYENNDKLVKVTSFGNLGLISLSGAFTDAINLVEVPSEIPSTITNLTRLFYNAEKFNYDISSWDVSNVANMSEVFRGASAFNQDISSWNTSNVTTMFEMFRNATAFNQNIGSWDVSKVTNMSGLFMEASAFNQDIGNWNVSLVNIMRAMFSQATNFNQDISKWNVSNVTDMSWMFEGATKFNQFIGDWNTSKVSKIHCMFMNASAFNQDIENWDVNQIADLNAMFYGAISFNQDLSNWDISNATNLSQMFTNVKLSTAFYNNILASWSAKTLKNNISFSAGNSQYSPGDAADARQYIIDTYGWTIFDGGISNLPAVITHEISDVDFTSATANGEVTEDAGGPITVRGIVWNITPYPTTTNNIGISSNGSGIGAFSNNLNSLNPGIEYHVRAYATSGNGTAYGNSRQFIPQQELTISGSFTANSKEYDGNISASINTSSIALENIVTGHENVTISNVTISFEDKNVGSSKPISLSDVQLSGSDSLKYSVSYIGSPTTTADITTKVLTVSGAVASNKVYDGNTNAEITGAFLEGINSGDDIFFDELIGSFSNKNVGTNKTVSPAITIAGTDSENYTLSPPSELTADIIAKEITISNTSASHKVYDGTLDAQITGTTLVGTISGDDISVDNQFGSFEDKKVGTNKTVNAEVTITGNDVGNYNLSQPTKRLKANITAKELTVNGISASDKIYDRSINAQITGATLIGTISGDDISISDQYGSFEDKNVGTNKVVTPLINITGTDRLNYTLTQPTELMANITAKELTVSGASASDKVYDGTTNAQITGASLVGAISYDDINFDQLNGNFSDKNIGTNISVTPTLTIKGTDSENYTLTQPSGLAADITEKELTISGSFTVLDKENDGTTSATINNNELTLDGIIENDDVSLVNEVAEFSQTYTGENITVNITSAELDGTDKENYILSLTGAPYTTANILSATGIQDESLSNLKVYPNPFVDNISIEGNLNITKIVLTNLTGQRLLEKDFPIENNIKTQNLRSGIYLITIEIDGSKTQTFKIIKK